MIILKNSVKIMVKKVDENSCFLIVNTHVFNKKLNHSVPQMKVKVNEELKIKELEELDNRKLDPMMNGIPSFDVQPSLEDVGRTIIRSKQTEYEFDFKNTLFLDVLVEEVL